MEIITLSVHNGIPNVPYQSTTFKSMASSTAPVTWSQPSGALPPGLSLAQVVSDYVLSGTPTTAGDYGFSIQVTNGTETAIYYYTMEIRDLSPWTIVADDPSSFPYTDIAGDAISINFDVAGGLKQANFEHKLSQPMTAYANDKLYSFGGVATTVTQTRNAAQQVYWDNRQGHLSIYDPMTDDWDTSYWRDWSVLGFINQYPINGMPTGYNWNTPPNGGTEKPIIGDGDGWSLNQSGAYDYDNDGTVEIYAIGGYPMWDPWCAMIYDPDTNEWSEGAAPVGMGLNGFRRGAVAQDGKDFYLVGGSGFGDGKQMCDYDAQANTWTLLAPAPNIISRHVAEVVGGDVYAIGGLQAAGYSTAVMKYNIAGNSWTTAGLTPIPVGVEFATSVVKDGKIYVIGGMKDATTMANLIQIYDPVANSWSTSATTLPTALAAVGAEFVGNDLYITSGATVPAAYPPIGPTNRTFKLSFGSVSTETYYHRC